MEKVQLKLFDIPPLTKHEQSFKRIQYPVWTERKAKLIQQYLYYFVLITKHGTYIDGFAGPQKVDEPDMWAARLAIENEPRWLRNFYLFEENKNQYEYLLSLKKSQPDDSKREIEIYYGDFNFLIHEFLEKQPIKEREATFCLLDQRTFECHWSTVKTLASYKKAGMKIELFYFLPIGWLDRALAAQKDKSVLDSWWGRGDWQKLIGAKALDKAIMFCKRFEDDFAYEYVHPWPIYEKRGGGRIMYYMIHATDHLEAPKLMRRAYSKVVFDENPHQQIKFDFENVKDNP